MPTTIPTRTDCIMSDHDALCFTPPPQQSPAADLTDGSTATSSPEIIPSPPRSPPPQLPRTDLQALDLHTTPIQPDGAGVDDVPAMTAPPPAFPMDNHVVPAMPTTDGTGTTSPPPHRTATRPSMYTDAAQPAPTDNHVRCYATFLPPSTPKQRLANKQLWDNIFANARAVLGERDGQLTPDAVKDYPPPLAPEKPTPLGAMPLATRPHVCATPQGTTSPPAPPKRDQHLPAAAPTAPMAPPSSAAHEEVKQQTHHAGKQPRSPKAPQTQPNMLHRQSSDHPRTAPVNTTTIATTHSDDEACDAALTLWETQQRRRAATASSPTGGLANHDMPISASDEEACAAALDIWETSMPQRAADVPPTGPVPAAPTAAANKSCDDACVQLMDVWDTLDGTPQERVRKAAAIIENLQRTA